MNRDAHGHAAGNAGVVRAHDANEDANPGWFNAAIATLVDFIRGRTDSFTIEEIREQSEIFIVEPTDKRAWGAVTRAAVRRKYIEAVPGGFAPARSSNGSPKQLYRVGACP